MQSKRLLILSVLFGYALAAQAAEPLDIIPEAHPWVNSMKKVAVRFDGTPGMVLHIGSLNNYYAGYGEWARGRGKGISPADRKIVDWMHAGRKNNLDGWYLTYRRHKA